MSQCYRLQCAAGSATLSCTAQESWLTGGRATWLTAAALAEARCH
jgi:hypothetical protein